jgi:hypothetical protein
MVDLLNEDLISYDQVTRKERRALLGISVLGVALVKIPLVPEKLSTFGIEFARPNQQAFLTIYAAVVAYFLVAFLIYALTDFIAWRRSRVRRIQEYTRQQVASTVSLGEAGVNMLTEERQRATQRGGECRALSSRGFASFRLAEGTAWFRAIFEFAVPVVFAIYTVAVLLWGAGAS